MRPEADEKALAKRWRQKYKNRYFSDPIFLTTVFFLGSPGTGRGMIGRGIRQRVLLPIPLPLILSTAFPAKGRGEKIGRGMFARGINQEIVFSPFLCRTFPCRFLA
jgi:hypothetical protein